MVAKHDWIREWKTNVNELGTRVAVALDDTLHSCELFSQYPNSQFRYAVGTVRKLWVNPSDEMIR